MELKIFLFSDTRPPLQDVVQFLVSHLRGEFASLCDARAAAKYSAERHDAHSFRIEDVGTAEIECWGKVGNTWRKLDA
ncbi:hypothetical protein EYW49_07920 [Siculibacillus lacustris]|uniref:Uncharacterized protein n=1 Tax=Siculibacillus lacustris TaxID=1549641 RepID=A0A4Q9VVI0_9HYPH|nr:hypothetical protein [Siculibacillus lacustris]TBW39048.1 hypothetical protein EYW49_07920 [Siculibacillus lacustris]